ncbi:hypothetical protein [Novosphingobium arvoryzae]|uniref:hypothetical protein n=1 Tax=Novosphingobium arvoryzae TaxID=1256514 RepID=UPI0035B32CA4
MIDEEPELIESRLSRTFTWHGYVMQIHIYQLAGDPDWTLEVVNEEGTSIVWDDRFTTDRSAFEAFQKTLDTEGIEAFLDDADVLPFRPSRLH